MNRRRPGHMTRTELPAMIMMMSKQRDFLVCPSLQCQAESVQLPSLSARQSLSESVRVPSVCLVILVGQPEHLVTVVRADSDSDPAI